MYIVNVNANADILGVKGWYPPLLIDTEACVTFVVTIIFLIRFILHYSHSVRSIHIQPPKP